MEREIEDVLPDLPIEHPRTRKELVEAATADDHLRPKLRHPYRAGDVYATNGHVLLQCPANESMLDMEFYGEEEWDGWHEEFCSMLAPPEGREVIDLLPVLDSLDNVRTVDKHEWHECPECGHEIQGTAIGERFAPAAVVHWRDQFWNPHLLSKTVVGAVAAEETTEASVYPVGTHGESDTPGPMIVDVGEVRMGIMMMEIGQDWEYYDFYNAA